MTQQVRQKGKNLEGNFRICLDDAAGCVRKEEKMKRSVLYFTVMVLAFLVMLRAPFMPYVHSDLLAAYLDYDALTAVGLVEQMYILHTMPGSVSIFGYAHYDLITLVLMILGMVMIALPVILEGVSLILVWRSRTEKWQRVGFLCSLITVFLFVAYFFVFSVAGSFLGVATRAGNGIFIALVASIVYTTAACLKRRAGT